MDQIAKASSWNATANRHTPRAPAKSRFVAIVRRPQVVARCFATALVQAGSQIPATGTFGHLVHIATLPGPWGPSSH